MRNLTVSEGAPSGTHVIVWLQARLKADKWRDIVKFVENGGSLRLCGNAMLNYHLSGNNANLFGAFGLTQGGNRITQLYNRADADPRNDILRVECPVSGNHPVLAGVRSFVTAGAGFQSADPKGFEVLVRAPATSSAPGKALIAVRRFGKGRMAYLADNWVLRLFNIDRGDNLQLFYNLIALLADKPPHVLTAAERDRALLVTPEKLAAAEADEDAGRTRQQPLQYHPTYIREKTAASLIGAAEDPIVDQFK